MKIEMHQNLSSNYAKIYPMYIYVFLEKLKSMIQQHTHKTGLNMTCWFNEKGKNLKVWPTSNVSILHTGI